MSENPFGRNAQEEAEYRRHLWPGTDVLRNKLDIRNREELERAERLIVSQRVEAGFPKDAHPSSYDGLKAMHRHMFQDIYDWAGQERKYTTGRGPAPFARPEFIAPTMNKLFDDLRAKNQLKGLDRRSFAQEAAKAVNEINAAHPFIDGNGRAQRQWLRATAREAGHRFILTRADIERWNAASREGFHQSDAPMAELIYDRTRTLSRQRSRSDRTRDSGRSR